MISIFNSLLSRLNGILKALNDTSIKRLVIYSMLIYPIVIILTYKNEVSLLFNASTQQLVSVHDLASAQERCFMLREKYNAEAVQLYIYQPASKNKHYKERIVFSTSSRYTPLESTKIKQLSSNSQVLEDFRLLGFSKITSTSGHFESSIVQVFNLSHMIITPIRDNVTGQIIGEVLWCFVTEGSYTIDELINAGQIFAYDINS